MDQYTKQRAAESIEIDRALSEAINLMDEETLRDKVFLLATLLRLEKVNAGLTNQTAADYVLGFLRQRVR